MENDETLQLFLEEARDHLRDIENDLLSIETETGPSDVDLVNKVFRGIHSIKGAAGFFGLNRIKEISHAMENLLNRIRNFEVIPRRAVVEALLRSADTLSAMVEDPSRSENVEIAKHLDALSACQAPTERSHEKVPIVDSRGSALFEVGADELEIARKGGKNVYLMEFDLVVDTDQRGKTPLEVLKELEKTGLIVEAQLHRDEEGFPVGSVDSLPFSVLYATVLDREMVALLTGLDAARIAVVDLPPRRASVKALQQKAQPVSPEKPAATEATPVAPAKSIMAPEPPEPAIDPAKDVPLEPVRGTPQASSTLRVQVKALDRLMTLAGELVLARNQLIQKVSKRDITEIQASSQGLSMIISELQEAVMATRMQPISIVFGKFQRVVRDMSAALGKEIRLDVEGEEVELDKAVIEAIGDPLTHLVRNAVDHGVEMPDVRERSGKPRLAVVRLHAYHEAGKVVIAVSDNGRGIDTEAVREKAGILNLVPAQDLAKMSEKELIELIFLPGFSTAKAITEISGRGVGMDVVKTNFTKLGGIIDVETKKGSGTTIRVKLPLTLAIIPSLLVSVQSETYAIPQVNLVELVRISASEVRNRIERIGDALVMRLRGRLLPLAELAEVLGMERSYQDPQTGEFREERRARLEDRRGPRTKETPEERERRRGKDRRFHSASAVNIAVLSAGSFQYGLIVDRLHESEEIVVKPLGSHFRSCQCYAGATILGDGRVAPILDVMGITKQRKLSDVGSTRDTDEETKARLRARDAQSMLLFHVAADEQFSIPLALVSRLEVVERSAIENLGGRRSVQYRGGSLPLLDLSEVAKIGPLAELDSYFVVVHAIGGKEVGLLVSQIVDIVESSEDFDESTFRQAGILGSAIFSGKTTLLVDVYEIVRSQLPSWIKTSDKEVPSRRILVVDDSPFYRRQISGFLRESGHVVEEACDGKEALEILGTSRGIEMVLTDIEMPVMDGLELTRQIRASKAFSHLAVVAVTSLSGEESAKRGKDAGVDGYLVKLDREKILGTVESFLQHRKP
ncbi:MAG: chemotaxis protein CheW [Fibrobacterota bacterium]|nr:chemotaxis protein CheW [Fibrobacterota bacterium]QQS07288.1 MAG: chemotaxis protein CheW [Fibrobacterota bacterium]